MSLQTKFVLLLASLSAAVLLALGTARWALGVTYREVREPVRTLSKALTDLVELEKAVDELRALAHPTEAFGGAPAGDPSPDSSTENSTSPPSLTQDSYRRLAGRINNGIDGLVSERGWSEFAGRSAVRNLRAKLDLVHATAESYLATGVGEASGRSLSLLNNQLFDAHELLKRIEARIVSDLHDLTESSADLRSRLLLAISLSLLLVVLMVALAAALVRRWVTRPLGLLRAAAARIASGDFEHRIPIAPDSPQDEMTMLSSEVNHMAAMVKQLQAERVEQERLAAIGELVRRLAHNLRNPLSGIRGLAELTLSDVSDLGPAAADVRENQTRIISAVDRFEVWLSDLLRVTKPTQITPTDQEVEPWLRGLIDAHLPQAQSLGVTITLETEHGPPHARFDPRQLEHALSAMLSNAIEAAKQNQTESNHPAVLLHSRTTRVSNAQPSWELIIADTGVGIPQHLRNQVFRPYFTTKADGNGIGLAAALQTIRGHGGQVQILDSQVGDWTPPDTLLGGAGPRFSGAVFVIRLPLAILDMAEDRQQLAITGHQGAPVGSNLGDRR
ncbi:MAG: sensor histidine kinase [Phycisphaerales bacterium]